MTEYKPKLIEVALPLAAINKEAAREKSIRHGHPSTLHLWWARRPLAAARAVIWASLVDDPSGDESLSVEQQEAERQRLFDILERLVKWENSNNPEVLSEAKSEIDRCFPDGPPSILDPFGGGGAIPLEAQRLGLKALSGDLNPVAVLIQKAMLEIPPRFAGRAPVHPDTNRELVTWSGAQGLAADVKAYGKWMREEAHRRVGHFYPSVTSPNGEELTPIAWIWARTVESPDPAWHGRVPLVASWTLRSKKGKPKVWIEPLIDRKGQTVSYRVREGGEPSYGRTVRRGTGTCIATGAPIPSDYIKSECWAGRTGMDMLGVVAEGPAGRVYVDPVPGVKVPDMPWRPIGELPKNPRHSSPPLYGMDEWWKLFTARQLATLTTFSDLLKAVHSQVIDHFQALEMESDKRRLHTGGSGAIAYADAVVTYLAFVVNKCADYWSTICHWIASGETMAPVFTRQAIPITWDCAESNPFSASTGNWMSMVDWIARAVNHLPASGDAEVIQQDATARVGILSGAVISTDPPYYDNVPYADLSDFYFTWIRRNLSEVWPDECATLATPKQDELVANRYLAGSKKAAERRFELGMARFMAEVAKTQNPAVPATVYYAYKATESKEGEVRSTGWDTFLQAVVDAGLQVTATWPLRTERGSRPRAHGSNALASSIVLTCRPRSYSAPLSTRGQFMSALRDELPDAVKRLQSGSVTPVDLPQSTIGPGIRIFSRYAKVVEADGSSMSVTDALAVINDVLGEILDGTEAELDPASRFAVTWYAQCGFEEGSSGDADNLARAKNASLAGIEASGIGRARAGAFRLYGRDELACAWDPLEDDRLTVWKATQHMVAALDREESEAARLLHQLGAYADRVHQLSYILFKTATESRNANEAASYNGLVNAWPILKSMSPGPQQTLL